MLGRTRLAIFALSIAIIGLEITLMRVLALRFWSHLAAMVISVALLGFGCSGTVLTLLQDRLRPHLRLWLVILAMAGGFVILACGWGVQAVPLDIHYLAWDLLSEASHVLLIEVLMMLPFFTLGAFLGLALMEEPHHIHGHYGANLAGSGCGAFLAVILMYHLSISQLLICWALLCWCAGLLLIRRSPAELAAAGTATLALVVLLAFFPGGIALSDYKRLALEKAKPDTTIRTAAYGPLGRIDRVSGSSIHDAPPGMSLMNPYSIPERDLLLVDGDSAHILYASSRLDDFRFLGYTTSALPFALGAQEQVLLIGSSAGAAMALARLHGSEEVVVLEANSQIMEILRTDQAGPGIFYGHKGVKLFYELPQTYLRESSHHFDLILVPLLDGSGAGSAGLHAARENHLFTLETFRSLIAHLTDTGMFVVTVHAHNPPRDGLRLFNLAIEALRAEGLDAHKRLALIRSWETLTLLAGKTPLTPGQLAEIRGFSEKRGFDLAYLPDLKEDEANRHHRLAEPLYARSAWKLLGAQREDFVDSYPFHLSVPTEDRPYFDHFMRWSRLQALGEQLKGRLPAFLQVGSLLSALAFVQVSALAAFFIIVPLFAGSATRTPRRRRGLVLIYFFLLGLGFMVLEMSFLQKMVLYLGHPIYSAAVVIASFLLFAGLGSQASRRWSHIPGHTVLLAGLLIVLLVGSYLLFLDYWLDLSQGAPLALRFVVVAATIAPLSFLMGFMFPLGLEYVAITSSPLVPWAWGVNGFASVLATAGTPLAAMTAGFSSLMVAALCCYLLAALVFWTLASATTHPIPDS